MVMSKSAVAIAIFGLNKFIEENKKELSRDAVIHIKEMISKLEYLFSITNKQLLLDIIHMLVNQIDLLPAMYVMSRSMENSIAKISNKLSTYLELDISNDSDDNDLFEKAKNTIINIGGNYTSNSENNSTERGYVIKDDISIVYNYDNQSINMYKDKKQILSFDKDSPILLTFQDLINNMSE